MAKRHKPKPTTKVYYRTNERIFASTVRVLDGEGKQIGVLSKQEALTMARDQELDLVEVAAKADPPVVKIIDFKKFLYQESKKKQEEKRKAKVSETKEVRLSPFISDNDLQVMVRRGKEFLEDGDKVRLVLKFKGRQIVHPEFGKDILAKTIIALADVSKVDREAHFEGRQLVALLSPERKKNAEKKDQGLSSETL